MQVVKLLLVAEIEVPTDCLHPEGEAQLVLDHFRESVLPSREYGITLYRAQAADVSSLCPISSVR